MRAWQMAAVLLLLAAAAGCGNRNSPRGRPPDPAVRAAAAVMGLERTPQPVTPAQAATLLPLFRALRGTRADDRPAVEALVRQIDAVLTGDQRAALRRQREQGRPGGPERPGGAGGPGRPPFDAGSGPPPGGGPGGIGPRGQGPPTPEQMALLRDRILDRAVAMLEVRVQQ